MVRSTHKQRSRRSAIVTVLTIWLPSLATGQILSQEQGRELPNVRVPFVPCKSDGQIGPIEAPKEIEKVIKIDPRAAQTLAYYQSAVAPGILAPRGWFCFGVYGSSGSAFFVRPEPIDENNPFPLSNITGRVVMIADIEGAGSGRVEVAQVIARVFPKHIGFVQRVIDLFDFVASEITYGPYPTDKLTYRSDDVVEFVTPPNSRGLGIMNLVKPSNDSIEGVAILYGPSPDLRLLTVRLPPELQSLSSQIIQQVEREEFPPK